MSETIDVDAAPRPTKRDLVERGIDALDLEKTGKMLVHQRTGDSVWVHIEDVLNIGKLMAASQIGTPKHLRGQAGACVRIAFQAARWGMDPFQLADTSFIVNDYVSYTSQTIHAIVEARAPLQHRLDCSYGGDGPTRTCTVRGMFINGDVREYTSPMVKDIRIKNSPLWKDDTDQQLFYYASRSWARKWVPDVLLGLYTREELQNNPALGYDETPPGLQSRLSGSDRADEGHHDGHAQRELDQIAAIGTGEFGPPDGQDTSDPANGTDIATSPKKRTGGRPRAESGRQDADTVAPEPVPKTPKAYYRYAKKWIDDATDADAIRRRWADERGLRNEVGMTADERKPLEELIIDRKKELS